MRVFYRRMNKPQEMNNENATAFALIGTALAILPIIYPEPFSSLSTTRLLWLQLMGAVNASIGLGWHAIDFVQANLALLERRHASPTGEVVVPAKPSAARPYWAYWAEQRVTE